ncbi:hypothetical protein [Priestia koreensis]|uniref:hypothetical protein n=1 Tax=Priestia koreensis TaxID=284581 RepID=UPI003457D5AF
MVVLTDAVALGCLERKVRDSCGISVTGETPRSSEEAHRTPRGKRSDLEWKSTNSVMNAILYRLFQWPHRNGPLFFMPTKSQIVFQRKGHA